MHGLVLSAGLGTRLLPHTRVLPKPLFPFQGKPLLHHHILSLIHAGCTRVFVNTHHLADQVHDYILKTPFPLPVVPVFEPDILGTGGAVLNISSSWEEGAPLIIINCDIVTNIRCKDILNHHRKTGAAATLALVDDPEFNTVLVSADGKIAGFAKQNNNDAFQDCLGRYTFTGIHVMEKKALACIPTKDALRNNDNRGISGSGDPAEEEDSAEKGKLPSPWFFSIIRVYENMIKKGLPVHAYIPQKTGTGAEPGQEAQASAVFWKDLGTEKRYTLAILNDLGESVFSDVFHLEKNRKISSYPLKGDGSDRVWTRLEKAGKTLVAVTHGITLSHSRHEADAFIDMGMHFRRSGVPVPRIHAYDRFSGVVVMEDAGDTHLADWVKNADTEEVFRMYSQAVEILLHLNLSADRGFDTRWCWQSPSYDRELILEKECAYFIHSFINPFFGRNETVDHYLDEFMHLADQIERYGIPGIIHRDYQSRNLMVQDENIRIIDFQGARNGPVQYDLASLLYDPYTGLSGQTRERLLEFALSLAKTRYNADPFLYEKGFRYTAISRNLQVLGAFGHLYLEKKKPGFAEFIPRAVEILLEHLQKTPGFPGLFKLVSGLGRPGEWEGRKHPQKPGG